MTHRSKITLFDHQRKAVDQIRPGKILVGGVGTGKTYTSLVYYLEQFSHLKLYVITTAKKRNDKDWEESAENLNIDIVVDSWNNIKKYKDITRAFFIFDEQKASGYGAWSKTFIHISKNNPWILLSATPGDTWIDYAPVFIANGFYKNITEFRNMHVEYDQYVKFPRIKAYHRTAILEKMRRHVSVIMPMERHTTRHREMVECDYDKDLYKKLVKDRWNIYENRPIRNGSELLQLIRRVTATDESRVWVVNWLLGIHDRVIVFYNFDYELEILRDICESNGYRYAEYNGHMHEPVPDGDRWIYLVHYFSGSEAWEEVSTNVILFYSLNYSYRIMEQCEGRIDRMNTKYTELEYFYITSEAPIDKSIKDAIRRKKKFNETVWLKRSGIEFE